MSKKSLITAVSAAAMVATLGFAYAQSADEGAYPNANINGAVDNNVPKHWKDGDVNTVQNDAILAPADTMPAPADSTATAPAADANSPWAADTSSSAALNDPNSAPPTAAGTTTYSTTDNVNQTNGSLTTNTAPADATVSAPSETRVDLNSPNDPIYNMGRNNSNSLDTTADTERAPRPDRN